MCEGADWIRMSRCKAPCREGMPCETRKGISQKLSDIGPIPVAAPSKAWVCGLTLAGIVDANPAGGMGVCLL
jgi:hypothetical protein